MTKLSYLACIQLGCRPNPIHPALSLLPSKYDSAAVIRHILTKYPPLDSIPFPEETDLRRVEEDHDLVIFNYVDSTLLDDSILSTMRLVLLRRLHSAERVFAFVVACLRSRIISQTGNSAITTVLALHTVSPTTRIYLVDILSDALHHELTKITVDDWYTNGGVEWMDDALTLIFALIPPAHSIPENATILFHELLTPSPASGRYDGCGLLSDLVISTACGQPTSEDWQAGVFRGLTDALKTVHPDIFRDLAHWSYLQDEELSGETATFEHILGKIRESRTANAGPTTLSFEPPVRTMVELAGLMLFTQVNTYKVGSDDDIERASPGFIGLLRFVVEAVPLLDDSPDSDSSGTSLIHPHVPGGVALDRVFLAFFTSPSLVYCLMECFERYPRFLSVDSANPLLFTPLLRLDAKSSISDNTLAAMTQFFDSRCKTEASMDLMLTLQLCLIATSLPSDSDEVSQALFRSIQHCVRRAYATHSEDSAPPPPADSEGEIARSILNIMDGSGDGMDQFRIGRPVASLHTVDDEDSRYTKWCKAFDVDKSRFPDELIDILRRLSKKTEDELGRKFWRVRRLEDLETNIQKITIP
ncbi:hypothetical protein EIP86_002541 [Pleurotus ostreatoroseus]|nr:hypothetical protein EIP86_002541 [Pleurotus ostreatoroseus]